MSRFLTSSQTLAVSTFGQLPFFYERDMSITKCILRRVGLCVCLPTFDLFADRTFVIRMHAEVRPYASLSI